jgi:hypothetical protein
MTIIDVIGDGEGEGELLGVGVGEGVTVGSGVGVGVGVAVGVGVGLGLGLGLGVGVGVGGGGVGDGLGLTIVIVEGSDATPRAVADTATVPGAIALASPTPSICKTSRLLECHAKITSPNSADDPSRALAENCTVSPIINWALSGFRMMRAIAGVDANPDLSNLVPGLNRDWSSAATV